MYRYTIKKSTGGIAQPEAGAQATRPAQPGSQGPVTYGAWAQAGPAFGLTGTASAQGVPAVQRVIQVKGMAIDSARITGKGAFKTRLNRIISQEAQTQSVAPTKVRQKLVEIARSAHTFHFDSLRSAVVEAISLTKSGVDANAFHSVHQAEATLSGAIANVGAFADFPAKQLWRLLMDGKHQASRGKYGFENEPGYMAAMMRGFTLMLQHLGNPLTADLYEQLHDECLRLVQDRRGNIMELGFRDSMLHAEGFGVDADTWSQAGFQELQVKYAHRRDGDPRYPDGNPVGATIVGTPVANVGPAQDPKVMKVIPLARRQCIRFANMVLGLYQQEVAAIDPTSPTSADQKLEAIVRCCQDLDQLHLFVDGNIRTIAFLVLNKLLIENGLSPAILNEPNVFDCKSIAELTLAVRQGQAAFQSLKG